jgi:Tol biopolymer transport system component
MHKKILLLLPLGFLVAMFVLDLGNRRTIASEEKDIAEPFETIVIGYGSAAKWSPDGTKISYLKDGWLWIISSDGKGESRQIACLNPTHYDWISNTELAFQEREDCEIKGKRYRILKIKKIGIDGLEQLVEEDTSSYSTGVAPRITGITKLADGTVLYYKGPGVWEKGFSKTAAARSPIILQPGRLAGEAVLKQLVAKIERLRRGAANGVIFLESVDGSYRKQVTLEEKYWFAKLSPDNTKILTGKVPISGPVVIDTSGQAVYLGVGDLEISKGVIANIPAASAEWSPDSKWISYQYGAASEEEVVSGDVYIVDVEGKNRIQITDTPDEIEMGGVWSPDGTKLLIGASASGKITVVDISKALPEYKTRGDK